MVTPSQWSVGQLVNVKPRTWAGINRPGGVGKITKLHYSNGFVESLDVKYIVGCGTDTMLDLDFVLAYEPLESNGRSRHGREFYTASPAKRSEAADDSVRPLKKAKKQQNTEKGEEHKAPPKPDENTDPKTISRPKTTSIRRKQDDIKKAIKMVKKAAPTKSDVTKKKEERPRLPATHVLVSKKMCTVSPLGEDSPGELRNQQKKSTKFSRPSAEKPSSKSDGASSSAGPAVVTQSNEGKEKFVLKKASLPKEMAKYSAVPVSLAAKCKEAAPRKILVHPKKKVQAKRLPLKRVYESQVKIADDFCGGIVGKPKATSLDEKEKDISAQCAVSLSPPNSE